MNNFRINDNDTNYDAILITMILNVHFSN